MRHHFVPEFMQRPWVNEDGDKKLEIFRLDLHELRSDRHAPKYAGVEKNLYALSRNIVAGMEKHANEDQFLKQVDSRAAIVRRKFARGELLKISNEERNDWALFLMSLRVRQPKIVNELKNDETSALFQEHLDKDPDHYENLKGESDPASMSEWVEQQYPGIIDNFGISIFSKIVDNKRVGNLLIQMNWLIVDISDAKHKFLLGDNPLILTHAITNPNLIVALPISPTKVFFAAPSREIIMKITNSDINQLVLRVNESSVNQSVNNIYSQDTQHWKFIQNRRF